jgi:peptidoglycan-associated lipoprotein
MFSKPVSYGVRHLILSIALITLVAGVGCSKKAKEDENSVPNAASADENAMGDSDSGKAMGLQTVHFPYDSFILDSEGKSTLKSNAEILKGKGSIKIQIEGHCDQRGGIQYNIALGEKRAKAAMKYLEDLGISADRITVISFGKEKPIDSAETEEAYAKNRRDNFVVTTR